MGQDSQLQVFTAELASEQIAKEAIEKLKQEYSGLVIKGVDDVEGYKAVDTARKFVKKLRNTVEAVRKKVTKPLVDEKAAIDKHAKALTALIEPIESELVQKQKAIDDEKARIAMQKVQKQQERIKKIKDIGMYGPLDNGSYRTHPNLEGEGDVEITADALLTQTDDDFQAFCDILVKRNLRIALAKRQREQERMKAEEKIEAVVPAPVVPQPEQEEILEKLPEHLQQNPMTPAEAFPQTKEIKEELDITLINLDTKEGKWLFAALAMITTELRTNKTPGEVLHEIDLLAKDMFE